LSSISSTNAIRIQLKELANKLEEHHVESERASEEEVGKLCYYTSEFTLSDLEAHRMLSQTALSERETQAAQATSLLSLTKKLQSSAVESRTRHLDADLLFL
jgi:hypothetical protein